MQQEGSLEALDREVHVPEVAAADAELASEVVAGRHPRQHLDGPERIVCQDSPQDLHFGAPQGLLGGRARFCRAERGRGHGDGLRIRPGAAAEGDTKVRGVALGEVQAALDEDVAHDRHRQPDAAPWQPTQLEGPRLGGQRLCLVVHAHADTSERLPGLRIDDLSLDQRALRRDRLLIADSTHRREEDDGENCNRGHKSVRREG